MADNGVPKFEPVDHHAGFVEYLDPLRQLDRTLARVLADDRSGLLQRQIRNQGGIANFPAIRVDQHILTVAKVKK